MSCSPGRTILQPSLNPLLLGQNCRARSNTSEISKMSAKNFQMDSASILGSLSISYPGKLWDGRWKTTGVYAAEGCGADTWRKMCVLGMCGGNPWREMAGQVTKKMLPSPPLSQKKSVGARPLLKPRHLTCGFKGTLQRNCTRELTVCRCGDKQVRFSDATPQVDTEILPGGKRTILQVFAVVSRSDTALDKLRDLPRPHVGRQLGHVKWVA